MKVQVYYIGKTTAKYLRAGEEVYEKRLAHYLPISFGVIPDAKQAGKLTPDKLTALEGERLLAQIKPEDKLILLDEGGQHYRSTEFFRLDLPGITGRGPPPGLCGWRSVWLFGGSLCTC